jgi:hypothetical protein
MTRLLGRVTRGVVRGTRDLRYRFDRFTFAKSGRSERVRALNNKHRDRPVLVVGNGPSLNETPLDSFDGVASIGMNKINLLFDRTTWRPDYIVCINNLVAKQNETFFATTDIPVWLSWKCRFFVNARARKRCEYFLSLPTPAFATDFSNGAGSAGTVTYAALQLAYYMGADPVMMVGVDHNYSVGRRSRSHDIERVKGEDVNHFDPNYFANGQYWGIPNLELSELGYRAARDAFEADGRRILDATIGGKLDIFPRISLEEVTRLAAAVPRGDESSEPTGM